MEKDKPRERRGENEHSGHRERLRTRFLKYGLDGFDDHNVLELLLFYSRARGDTNALAHRLVNTFGGLPGVFEATAEMLMAVDGVGENTAALIRLVPELARRYEISRVREGKILLSSEDVGRYLMPFFMGSREERVYLLCLDGKMQVLDCREMGRGDPTSVSMDIRRIVQVAIEQNAAVAVLAHNHVSGIALPSPEDKLLTQRLRDVLKAVGVTLVDHIIVADGDFVSMADSGFFRSGG